MPYLSTLVQKFSTLDSKTRQRLFLLVLAITCIVAWVATTPTEERVVPVSRPSSSAEGVDIQPESIFVHVAGAVKHPGVYSAPKGARLFEIIALAGGFASQADQSSVNLARTVEDGEQLSILKIGKQGSVISGASNSATSKINLNRANSSELESLPGVGPKLAGRILDWRTTNGGFNHVADLLEVGGIGDKLYAAIKPMVML